MFRILRKPVTMCAKRIIFACLMVRLSWCAPPKFAESIIPNPARSQDESWCPDDAAEWMTEGARLFQKYLKPDEEIEFAKPHNFDNYVPYSDELGEKIMSNICRRVKSFFYVSCRMSKLTSRVDVFAYKNIFSAVSNRHWGRFLYESSNHVKNSKKGCKIFTREMFIADAPGEYFTLATRHHDAMFLPKIRILGFVKYVEFNSSVGMIPDRLAEYVNSLDKRADYINNWPDNKVNRVKDDNNVRKIARTFLKNLRVDRKGKNIDPGSLENSYFNDESNYEEASSVAMPSDEEFDKLATNKMEKIVCDFSPTNKIWPMNGFRNDTVGSYILSELEDASDVNDFNPTDLTFDETKKKEKSEVSKSEDSIAKKNGENDLRSRASVVSNFTANSTKVSNRENTKINIFDSVGAIGKKTKDKFEIPKFKNTAVKENDGKFNAGSLEVSNKRNIETMDTDLVDTLTNRVRKILSSEMSVLGSSVVKDNNQIKMRFNIKKHKIPDSLKNENFLRDLSKTSKTLENLMKEEDANVVNMSFGGTENKKISRIPTAGDSEGKDIRNNERSRTTRMKLSELLASEGLANGPSDTSEPANFDINDYSVDNARSNAKANKNEMRRSANANIEQDSLKEKISKCGNLGVKDNNSNDTLKCNCLGNLELVEGKGSEKNGNKLDPNAAEKTENTKVFRDSIATYLEPESEISRNRRGANNRMIPAIANIYIPGNFHLRNSKLEESEDNDTYSCKECLKDITSSTPGCEIIFCQQCALPFHIDCVNVKKNEAKFIATVKGADWHCRYCDIKLLKALARRNRR